VKKEQINSQFGEKDEVGEEKLRTKQLRKEKSLSGGGQSIMCRYSHQGGTFGVFDNFYDEGGTAVALGHFFEDLGRGINVR